MKLLTFDIQTSDVIHKKYSSTGCTLCSTDKSILINDNEKQRKVIFPVRLIQSILLLTIR